MPPRPKASKKLIERALASAAEGSLHDAVADLARARVPFDEAKARLATTKVAPAVSSWILGHAFPSTHESNDVPVESHTAPRMAVLAEPEPFLHWITHANECGFRPRLRGVGALQVFGAAALTAIARSDRRGALQIELDAGAPSNRFAHAIGMREAIEGREPPSGQLGRTVPLRRLPAFGYDVLEPTARRVASLIVPSEDHQETRKTMAYVVTELLRNVVQHSRDKQGAIVGAQLMSKGRAKYREDVIQVAVADNGIGIFESIKGMHEELEDPASALVKALEPHVSGAFPEEEEGTDVNAGLGLFFVSEMAKLTGGRMMIATRGASFLLTGDPDFSGANDLRILRPSGLGYPGTLVVFEAPRGSVVEHDQLLATIRQRAKERRAKRGTRRLFVYAEAPADTKQYLVRLASEDTVAASQLSSKTLLPLLARRQPVVLNFEGVEVATQSFLHALLFEALRVAWALRVSIYVRNAVPAVHEGLDFLESYALRS